MHVPQEIVREVFQQNLTLICTPDQQALGRRSQSDKKDPVPTPVKRALRW